MKRIQRSASFGEAPMLVKSDEIKQGHSRWTVLILAGLVLFGNYYAFDLPASLNTPLRDYLEIDYNAWQWELNLMYSLYSLPNMFLPAIGGHFIDRYDSRLVLFILASVICIGQTMFFVGSYFKYSGLMILGRLVFGIGGECIAVSESAIVTSWFQGKELAFALGMNLCVARLGSVFNSIISPRISNRFGPVMAVWVGTLACYMSFIATLILILVITVSNKQSQPDVESETLLAPSIEDDEVPQKSTLMEDIRKLPKTFWLLCALCVLLYGTVIPFNATVADFLTSKWYHNDIELAGFVMSLPDIVSFLVVPLFGLVVDRYGARIHWLLLCSFLIAGSHLVLGFSDISPIPAMICLGFGYAIYGVVLWSSMAHSIQHREHEISSKTRLLGIGFGVSIAALNTALTLIPLLTTQIRQMGHSFVSVEVFYASLGVLGSFVCGFLLIEDRKSGSLLRRSSIDVDQAVRDIPQFSPLKGLEVDEDDGRSRTNDYSSIYSDSSVSVQVMGLSRFSQRVTLRPTAVRILEDDQVSIDL